MTSYYKFLSDIAQTIRDSTLDFARARNAGLQGQAFDDEYALFVNKIIKKCSDFARSNMIRKKSEFLDEYIDAVKATINNGRQYDRLSRLLDITEEYVKKCA